MWTRAPVGRLFIALAGGASCCVAGHVRVRTPRGEVAIASLAVGDRVDSVDVAAGRVVVGEIAAVRRATRECLALRWRGGELVCTPDHPLYAPESGAWRPASAWVTGGLRRLLVRLGEGVEVVEVDERAPFAGVHEVVDLTLADEPHNFVAAGVVVHNKSLVVPEPPPLVVDGPALTLTADEAARRLRVRVCDDGRDVEYLWAGLSAMSADEPAAGAGARQWLSMYAEGEAEQAVVDGAVPGSLELEVDPWPSGPGQSCADGFVVGFERQAAPADGAVAVTWEITLHGADAEDADAVVVTFDPEA